mmetsp:Transcript_17292/g.18653  ORF Transcript_17292/g.18653 Transcript_17292/m.18653 type:complete len:129 (+) Transcript_17292:1044-1430(+)
MTILLLLYKQSHSRSLHWPPSSHTFSTMLFYYFFYSSFILNYSPQTLMAAREKLYELLVNCIPASTILKSLTGELLNNLDDSVKLEVIQWASFYEHRIAVGSKDIFHLEAFVAKFMAIYKKYLNDLFG